MITRYFDHEPLVPSRWPDEAKELPVRLPVGGPVGVGGKFAKGRALGRVSGAARSEVWTLDVSGGPASGTWDFNWTHGKGTESLTGLALAITNAALKAALETIFGEGNILSVTGTPGTSWVVTFGGLLANVKMGGAVGTPDAFNTGSIALTRTTAGRAGGGGQWDYYDDAAGDGTEVFRGVLKHDFFSDSVGGRIDEYGATGQPYCPPVYVRGVFRASDVTGLDAAALADPGVRLIVGTAVTDAGAEIGIGV